MFDHLKPVPPSPYVQIGRACHEANRAWCLQHNDTTQVSWDDTPGDIKTVVLQGIAYLDHHPDATEEALHDEWVKNKIADGWVLGNIKDATAKTHPLLVPFDQMTTVDQIKDRLFFYIARIMLGQM